MLPPIEKSPILVLQWSDRVRRDSQLKEKLVPLVKRQLEDFKLVILPNPSQDILLLTTTQKSLEQEAEKIFLTKLRRMPISNHSNETETIMDQFTVAERSQYLPSAYNSLVDVSSDADLFTVNERAILVQGLFQDVQVSNNQLEQLLLQVSQLQTLAFQTQQSELRTTNLWYLLQSNGLVDAVAPVHLHEKKEQIFRNTMKRFFQMTPPLEEIEEYYGPSIAVYFAFMSFLGRWLSILTIPGIIVFVFRQIRHDNIDTDEYMPFYGLFCFVWAILLCRFWERQENTLAYKWGTMLLAQGLGDDDSTFAVEIGASHQRPQFQGSIRISPVTFKEEMFYPSYKRKLKYLLSAVVTVFMLSIAFFIMILSLNLQGYIRPKHALTRHPFYFATLAACADKGSIFDANSMKSYIPVVLHAVCIFSLNRVYRRVATWLTEYENHKTEDAFQNSLNLKRFLFECFDCYIALFYLAFYERDVEQLRMELVAVFNVDAVRRFGTEVILPFAVNRWGQQNKSPDIATGLFLDIYEPFDDYMETLIQFGYVTLFASAYPMASMAMCISVWIEIRSGLFRFTRLYQKPLDERVSSIGMWKDLLRGMVWFSCLTNCFLFGFTSDQMLHYLPNLFEQTEDGETLLAEGKGRLVILLIFGIERILIFTGLILNRMIPVIPGDLSVKLRRRLYLLGQQWREVSEIKKAD